MDRNSELETEMFRMDKDRDKADRRERNKYIFSSETPDNSNSQRKLLVFVGIGVLLLIIVFSLFFIGSNETRKDLSSIRSNLDQVEKRLTQVEDKIARLNKEVITSKVDFDKNMEQRESQMSSLERRLDEQSKRIEQLQEAMSTLPTKKKSPEIVHKKPTSQTIKRYHEVRKGETLYGIARRYGISVDKLCRLNHITAETVVRPGQKLLVASGS
jgi:LysM repeat protein